MHHVVATSGLGGDLDFGQPVRNEIQHFRLRGGKVEVQRQPPAAWRGRSAMGRIFIQRKRPELPLRGNQAGNRPQPDAVVQAQAAELRQFAVHVHPIAAAEVFNGDVPPLADAQAGVDARDGGVANDDGLVRGAANRIFPRPQFKRQVSAYRPSTNQPHGLVLSECRCDEIVPLSLKSHSARKTGREFRKVFLGPKNAVLLAVFRLRQSGCRRPRILRYRWGVVCVADAGACSALN